MSEYRLIGRDYTPPDLVAKVTGKAKFAEDFRADGMLFVKLLPSPLPHAKVRRIDASQALAMEGVESILTADDLPAVRPPGEAGLTNEPLYWGEPILALAATDETIAAEALERVKVDLEPLPFVLDPLESLRPGGPNARPEGNTLIEGRVETLKWTARDFDEAGEDRLPTGKHVEGWSFGNLQEEFASAELILDETVVHQSQTHHPLEPRSVLAYWQNGKLHLYGSTQSTAQTVAAIAGWVGIDPSQVVLVSEYTGGAFGSKIAGSLNMLFPALLAKKTGRPVMFRVTRAEESDFGRARAGFQARVKMGFRKNGRLAALDLYVVQDHGPYGYRSDFLNAGYIALISYQPMAMRFRGVSVFTNTPPRGDQRAPGGAQINIMLDPILDKAARRLEIDRVAIRRLNAPDRNTRFGSQSLTSAYVREAFDRGRALFKWEEQKKLSRRQQGSRVTGVGVGLGCFSAGTVGFDGLILIKPDGRLNIHTGCGNLGTQSYSDSSRVAAEVLGMPWEKCEVVWGYTAKNLPWSPPQAGSQTTYAHSRANFAAATDAKRKLQEIAARDLGGSPDDYELGNERVYRSTNPSRRLSFAQAARRAIELGGKFSGHQLAQGLNPMTVRSAQALAGQGLIGVEKDQLPHRGMTVSFVVGFARIELDRETGHVEIVDYMVVADCGTVINPRGLGGQLHGGSVQGFGIACSQKWILDRRWGANFARRLHRAKPPTILDVPLDMEWDAVNLPDPFSPVGAKGIGEPPVAAGATAVLSAIHDALGKGELFNRTPVTTDMIVEALEALPRAYATFAAHV